MTAVGAGGSIRQSQRTPKNLLKMSDWYYYPPSNLTLTLTLTLTQTQTLTLSPSAVPRYTAVVLALACICPSPVVVAS